MDKYREIMERVSVTDEMQSRVLENVSAHFARQRKIRRIRNTVFGIVAAAAVFVLVIRVWRPGKGMMSATSDQMEYTAEMSSAAAVGAEPAPAEMENAAPSLGLSDEKAAGADSESYAAPAQAEYFEESDAEAAAEEPMETEGPAGEPYGAEYLSAAELSEAVGFPVEELSADALPFAAQQVIYSSPGGEIAQIEYYGGTDEVLTLRTSEGLEDNSGVYEEYPVVTGFRAGGADGAGPAVDVTLKGDGKRTYLALWSAGGYSWSLSSAEGLSKEEAAALAEDLVAQLMG